MLLISMLYDGALSPPRAFVVTSVTAFDTIQISKSQLSHETLIIVFFYCNSIGFAFSIVGLLFVLVYTLFPKIESQVTKSMDTFIAYVMDADEVEFANDNKVSIPYQDAIFNNITKTLSCSLMKYFLQLENRNHKLKKYVPVNYKVLFNEVLEFYKKCFTW